MKLHPSGFFEVSNGHSCITMSNSMGNIEFSYSDNDGGGACFALDPDDLRRMLDKILADEARKEERERCAKICADLANEYQAKWLEAEARGGRSMEYFIRSATAAECERKIRGEG